MDEKEKEFQEELKAMGMELYDSECTICQAPIKRITTIGSAKEVSPCEKCAPCVEVTPELIEEIRKVGPRPGPKERGEKIN